MSTASTMNHSTRRSYEQGLFNVRNVQQYFYKRPRPPRPPCGTPPPPSKPPTGRPAPPSGLPPPRTPPTRWVGSPSPKFWVRSDAMPRSSLRHLPSTSERGGRQISTQRSIRFVHLNVSLIPQCQESILPVLASAFAVPLDLIRPAAHGGAHDLARWT